MAETELSLVTLVLYSAYMIEMLKDLVGKKG